MRQTNKDTIRKIRELHEKNGFICKEETPIIRSKNDMINSKVAKHDLCCEKKFPKILKCFEIEDSQFQAVENRRKLQQTEKDFRQKGYFVKTCQMLVGENEREVCK